jgi:chromosome partitioning protein
MPKQHAYCLLADELALLTGQPVKTLFQSLQWESRGLGRRVEFPPSIVRRYLREYGVTYSFKVIAYISLKGGTGKTTSAISMATRAVQYGFRTCLVDLDPQASTSLAFDLVLDDDEPIFYDVWRHPTEHLEGALKQLSEDLWILPSSLQNSLLDLELLQPENQCTAVRSVCAELQARGMDVVLIDCPPSLGTAVISTICAADVIIVPVCADAFSLRGLTLTLREIDSICRTFHRIPPILKILYTKFDKRIRLSVEEFDQLATQYPDKLLTTPIRTSTAFLTALKDRLTIFASSRHTPARDDYDHLVREVLGIQPGLR